ncbi:MAG: type VI secretion system tip protein VgrG [Planctomycetes bacterium]|jgi:type VI secretion system secreted protein VgrG|nr:type VI secretion system tip protein VgrG [Planctomycetota bacterium]
MVEVTKRVYQLHNGAVADGTLVVAAFRGVECLSTPFRFELDLVSSKTDLDGEAILAAEGWLGIKQPTTLAGSGRRGVQLLRIHGVLTSFEQHGRDGDGVRYQAVLMPRLSRLALTSQSRIFQDLSTIDIVKQVLKDHGFEPDDACWRISGRSYPTREYVVQYRENDLAFISRLLEHEGIFYHFEHHDERSTVVFGDQPDACNKLTGNTTFVYRTHVGGTRAPDAVVEESVFELSIQHKPVTGQVVLGDFNYRTPGAPLYPSASVSSPAAFGTQYEYGDHFKDDDEGAGLAGVRAEEITCRKRRFRGASDARAFRAGGVFTLRDHYRGDVNLDHLLIEVTHHGEQGFATADLDEHPTATYRNEFASIPADVVFRPPRQTPKPVIPGTLTAKIDAAGDGKYAELDDQGRYKVKFPFDHSDKKDGKASRLVRMAQPYGGDQMGMHFPLHKGTEVLITHVNGDPDRPVIAATVPNPSTGSMVKGENQTQSVIRTGGKNAVVLEDTDGAEEFNLNATRDHLFEIGHDSEITVANNAKESVGVNNSQTIGSNDSQSVGADRTVSVGANLNETIGSNEVVMIGVSSTETIGVNKALTIGVAYEVTVGAAMAETVGASRNETVGVNSSESVGGNKSVHVGGNQDVEVGKDAKESIDGKLTLVVKKDYGAKAKKIMLEAEDELTIKVGKATLVMKKNGDITMNGKKITIKGDGDVVVKGSKIAQN